MCIRDRLQPKKKKTSDLLAHFSGNRSDSRSPYTSACDIDPHKICSVCKDSKSGYVSISLEKLKDILN